MRFPRRQFLGSLLGLLTIPFTHRSKNSLLRKTEIIPSPFVPVEERCFPQPMVVWSPDGDWRVGRDLDGNEAFYIRLRSSEGEYRWRRVKPDGRPLSGVSRK